MSGAFGYPWITLAMAGFFILLGILQFVPRRYKLLPDPEWLVEARRVHGSGPARQPKLPSRRTEIFLGIMFVLLGLLRLTDRHPDGFDRGFAIVMGGLFLVFALFMLPYPLLSKGEGPSWSERRRKRKLERRLARGNDAYADELLSILTPKPAYRLDISPGWKFAQTLIFVLAGAGLLAAGLATTR